MFALLRSFENLIVVPTLDLFFKKNIKKNNSIDVIIIPANPSGPIFFLFLYLNEKKN